ncbi:hypothetical protein HGM15179_016217 [Zosterops borbonicus]|uniref:Retroviral nucleocapsid Gag protein p24 C-terminal domain-containing protein n=1 Tax=Zosterops borbonicus TaxID=364589 RepID=A0A8K1G312_9PASS|nr:hypothetical protein HGM15179_016217 [Zosterops borbonicus]
MTSFTNAPPSEWPEPCPSSGSHAPPSGSHGWDPEGDGPEAGSPDPGSVPTLTPVTYRGSRGGRNTTATWRPLPQGVIKDLMKTPCEYGCDSPYFQGLLSSSLAGQVVVPFDLKQLFRCLSNKTEYKLWEATWKDLLGRTLPSLLKDPTTSTDNGGDPITIEHLMGEGEWKSASDQAEDILEGVLEIIKEKAQTTFCEMRPAGPLTPYSEVFQGPTEPFVSFVERLTAAVEQQVPRVHAREEVLEEMVSTHANETCKEAILRIPEQPGEYPTLDEMLRATSTSDLTGDPSWVSTPNQRQSLPSQDTPPDRTTRLIVPEPEGSIMTTSRLRRTPVGKRPHGPVGGHNWLPDPPRVRAVAIEERPTLKLNWLSDEPVWVEQWPLSKQKLKALNDLVQEQLRKGNIVESTSLWNSPVFVIQKSDKDQVVAPPRPQEN